MTAIVLTLAVWWLLSLAAFVVMYAVERSERSVASKMVEAAREAAARAAARDAASAAARDAHYVLMADKLISLLRAATVVKRARGAKGKKSK